MLEFKGFIFWSRDLPNMVVTDGTINRMNVTKQHSRGS